MVGRFLALLATIFGSSLLITAIAVGCGPGNFVNSTTLVCEKCPNGTFTDQENAQSCLTCRRCVGRNKVMVKPCTPTSNTQCECSSGHYFDAFLICLKCQPCKRGFGFVSNCTATRKTTCERCEKGKTFSSGKGFDGCKPCSKCQKGEVITEKCTRRRDTKCAPEKDKNNSKPKDLRPVPTKSTLRFISATRLAKDEPSKSSSGSELFSTLSTNVPAVTGKAENESFEEDEIAMQAILYSLIVLLFILVILAMVFVWHRKRSSRKRPKNRGKPVDSCEEPSTRTNSSEVVGAVENPYSSLPFIGGRHGDKMLRDVSYTLISELSQYLNPGERWKQLGGRLQFNTTQINNFALDKRTATDAMLGEWGQRDSATVVALRDTFKAMKWSKEANITAAYV